MSTEVATHLPITQAMILAAGKGKRLRPLTLTTPKPLVEVGGQPLIVWHILALKQAGITDIVINVSWLADKLIQALGDGSQFGVNLHWSNEADQPLETAGGIKQALAANLLQHQPFILVNGDVWSPYDFRSLTHYQFAQNELAHLLLTDQADHNPNGDFALAQGMVKLEGDAKYTFAGISVLSPDLFDQVAVGDAMPLAPLLKQAISEKNVTGELLQEKWVDVGTVERLDALNQAIKTDGYQGHLGAMVDSYITAK